MELNMAESWVVQSNGSTSFSDDSGRVHDRARGEPIYDSFLCPLTKVVMVDPVTLENGQTYERNAIERWFQECKINGRAIVCPMTGKELESTVLKPSLALRQTIEEWTVRNQAAQLENAAMILSSGSEKDIDHALKDVQRICLLNTLNKHKARASGLIPLIVGCLKKDEKIRCLALATLRILAEDVDSNKDAIGETDAIRNCIKCLSRDLSKEREEAVSLLYELSKSRSLCDKIVSMTGAILMLVKTVSSNSDNVITVQRADETLRNLEQCDQSVRPMAENGRLQPLLQHLIEGSEDVQLDMATILSELVLSSEGNAKVAEIGGKTLVNMLQNGPITGREAALKSLCQLSHLESNGDILANAGILSPLIRDLFAVGINQLPVKLKEVAATTLANIVSSGIRLGNIPIDANGNTLLSEPIIHNLLHLVSNTGPSIEAKLLQILVGLASSKTDAHRIVMAIKSAGATISLIQFLEAPQKELRANAVKLLCHLSTGMGQELADGLRITTGQLGTLVKFIGMVGVSEEQAAAAKLLADLPIQDAQLTTALLDEGTVPVAVNKLEELNEGIIRAGANRFLSSYKEGLVGILFRFTVTSGNRDTVISCAQEHNLTSLFTKLLNTESLDEIQRLSALALANLSCHSKDLSETPEDKGSAFCFCLFKANSKKIGLCQLHGGRCSARKTFCLYEANAIRPLVLCLDHGNVSVVEASLKALSTVVLESGNTEGGIQVLTDAGAIQPILEILKEHKTDELRQLVVAIVECLLGDDEMARTISTNAAVHTALVEAFKYGNTYTKQTAERALKHLNKIPNFSGVFVTKSK